MQPDTFSLFRIEALIHRIRAHVALDTRAILISRSRAVLILDSTGM